jgi:hypothetical protein
MYEKFTRTNLEGIRKEFDSHMKEFEKKTGIEIKLGKINYQEYSFKANLSATLSSKKEDLEMKKEAEAKHDFEIFAKDFGLEPEDYGKVFKFKGSTFKVVGFNLNCPKNRMELIDINTKKKLKCPEDLIIYCKKNNFEVKN